MVWRVFHANLAIVSPVMTPDQHAHAVSLFAQMRGKNDYVHVNKLLVEIAEHEGLQLRDVSLW